jgi:hypothetical protein
MTTVGGQARSFERAEEGLTSEAVALGVISRIA